MEVPDDAIELGYVSAVFGIKGWVRLHSYTQPREKILRYKQVWLSEKSGAREVLIAEGSRNGNKVSARFDGVETREQAETLINAAISVPRSALPATAKNEYYWADLVGLQVFDQKRGNLGIIDHLIETGANDVLVVRGDKEILIPFIPDDVIKHVDPDEGRVDVDWEWE